MPADTIQLAEWIDAIRKELCRAEELADREDDDLRLHVKDLTVEAELVAETTDATGGEVTLWVVKGNGSGEVRREATQRVSIHLHPTRDVFLGDDSAESRNGRLSVHH